MDIIAFVLTEPGAMGMGGLFACITNKKEYAEYNYVNGDIFIWSYASYFLL